jgi:hypothetical protein
MGRQRFEGVIGIYDPHRSREGTISTDSQGTGHTPAVKAAVGMQSNINIVDVPKMSAQPQTFAWVIPKAKQSYPGDESVNFSQHGALPYLTRRRASESSAIERSGKELCPVSTSAIV